MEYQYIITGASSDVGMEFIRQLDESFHGTDDTVVVYCQYYSSNKLFALRSELSRVSLVCMKCELSDEEDTLRWIRELETLGVCPTNIVHLAAAKFDYMRLKDFDWQRIDRELRIQVNGCGQLLKAFLPKMKAKRTGKVVAMLTAYTINVPPKFMTSYIVSKYALLGLIKSAAAEYTGTGVSINAISPNMMETKFLENLDERQVEMNARSSAMKRNLTTSEVVKSILFFMSSSSDYITGVNFNISGGDRM